MKINPQLTQDFISSVKEKAVQGSYRVNLTINNKPIALDIFPEVFPPQSNFSESSRSVYERFGDLTGKLVADIGCGSGVESIAAALAGAKHVDATDISAEAVACTQHNVSLNELAAHISVYQSDLLSSLPHKKYDLIIANLPIVDYLPENPSPITEALYDPDFTLHKRLLIDAKDYLAADGEITFTHANLQSRHTDTPSKDFDELEVLIHDYGYTIIEKDTTEALDYTWINYKIAQHS